jgi:chromosomal replication initiation ATPase DnaA
MSQLALDLELRPALGRDDFLVTASNAAAVALIDQWPDWPSHAAAIVGPPGSGKTHLAEVFRQKTGAERIDASQLNTDNLPDLLRSKALVVEKDAGTIDERALFHAFNLAKQMQGFLLLTTEQSPSAWNVALPDLRSRLNAVPVVSILLPDDDLLRGVLVKHFADRQIAIGESVIAYLAQRIPRSLEAVRAIVTEIDRRALQERADVTRPFVARVLEEFTNPELFEPD